MKLTMKKWSQRREWSLHRLRQKNAQIMMTGPRIEKQARERAPKTKTTHKRQINIQRLRQSTRWSEAEICMVSKMNSISMLRSVYREQLYRPFMRSPTEPGFEASYACALWVITDSCHNPCAPINSSEEQQEHNNTAVAIII